MSELANSQVTVPVLALLGLTSLLILIGRDWRVVLAALAFQYLGAFVLIALSWPVNLAWVKLVGGWMACLIIAAPIWYTPPALGEESFAPSGRTFRTFAAGLVGLVIYATIPGLQAWLIDIEPSVIAGSLILVEMGLMQLAMTSQPLRMTIGLLTVLTGFEIIYAAVESSILIAGLLAGFTISLALVGAYLIVAPGLEKEAQ